MPTTPADVITDFAAALPDGRLDDALARYEPDAAFTSADVLRRRPDGTWGLLIDNAWGA
jgi:hypothetical protein